MTKNIFKLFPKKPSELPKSSELPASGFAKHPCIMAGSSKYSARTESYKKLDFFINLTSTKNRITKVPVTVTNGSTP